jgi:hypothetical protein
MEAYSIAGINSLPHDEKREIFVRLIPDEIFTRFHLPEDLIDKDGNNLLEIKGEPGKGSLELSLWHEYGFQDPLLYSHLIDTLNSQIHVLLYIMNDPDSPRFDVDVMPDGTRTMFATQQRNLEAELAAMAAGLLPGQVRRGLSILKDAVISFEQFIAHLGHNLYFNQPLYYHNAIIFERYGFNYQSGKRRMEEIHHRFEEDDALITRLDGSPFRNPAARTSIFHRSWAIHDGILGDPFPTITMYKALNKKAKVNTAPGIHW